MILSTPKNVIEPSQLDNNFYGGPIISLAMRNNREIVFISSLGVENKSSVKVFDLEIRKPPQHVCDFDGIFLFGCSVFQPV